MIRALRINEERFRADFELGAMIGSSGDGGVNRPELGKEHLAAWRWLRDRIEDASLELRIDSAGKPLGVSTVRPGRDACAVVGFASGFGAQGREV